MDLSNNLKLKVLMNTHNLTSRDVCNILELECHKGTHSHSTLNNWLKDRAKCPPYVPKLIRYEMKIRQFAKESLQVAL